MKKIKLLLVDDDPIILKTIGKNLKKSGYEVTIADCGEKALDLLADESFDIVLTDIVMGKTDGLEILNKAKESNRYVKVLLLTGYGSLDSAIEALRGGADDYMLKPCEAEEIHFRIHKCVEKLEMQKKLDNIMARVMAQNIELEAFTRMISHDIKSPLATIGITAQTMKKHLKKMNVEGIDPYLDRIDRTVKKISDLMSAMLSYTLYGAPPAEFRKVPFKEIVSDALMVIQPQASDREVIITFKDSDTFIFGDKSQLTQVLINLIGNSVKYMNPEEKSPEIEIGAIEQDGATVYYVKDNGVGIAPEHLESVFNIFFRTPETKKLEGTGVGLAIVKRIIDTHKGKIRVESTPGKGSTFFFTLNDEQ